MAGKQQLTLKMRRAVRHYVEHGVKAEAYRYAYDCSRMAQETIWRNAIELFNHPLVQQAVMEAQMRQEQQFDVHMFEVKELLMEIAAAGLRTKRDAQDNEVPISLSAAKEALAEINRMNGNHQPIRLGGDPDNPLSAVISITRTVVDPDSTDGDAT